MGGVEAVDQMWTGYYSVEMASKSKKLTARFVEAMFIFLLTEAWVACHMLDPALAKEVRNAFIQYMCNAFNDNNLDDFKCHVIEVMEQK